MLSKNNIILLLLFVFILILVRVDAYRPVPKPYSRCQEFLRNLVELAGEQAEAENKFPPEGFRFNKETGEIPREVLIEQALIEDDRELPPFHWRSKCKYAIAPWARDEKGYYSGKAEKCIYCRKHGFLRDVYKIGYNEAITRDIVKKYFLNRCEEHGLDQSLANRLANSFEPDYHNLEPLPVMIRKFLKLFNVIGWQGFVLIHLLLTCLLCLLFVPDISKIKSLGSDFWISFSGSWLIVEGFYMIAFPSMLLDGWHSRYIRFPGSIVAVMSVFHILLFFFSLVLLVSFIKSKKSSGRLIFLIFASVIGILGINIISTILGLIVAVNTREVVSGQTDKVQNANKTES